MEKFMDLIEEDKTQHETEDLIKKALKKIGGNKEKDICKYLPAETEGYMHHFTLRKIKKTNPNELRSLIQEFILESPTPRIIDPKPRARRNKSLSLNQSDLKLILKLAQKTGDKHLLSKLGAKLSLPRIKRELIKSIKEDRVEEELWYSYIQALESSAIESAEM
jgi:hypothetical protein